MSQQFGIEASHRTNDTPEQPPVRYLVVIDDASTGARVARLFLASREQVAEFDAAAPEVMSMVDSLAATHSAMKPEWDSALGGHSPIERAAADVYTLDV